MLKLIYVESVSLKVFMSMSVQLAIDKLSELMPLALPQIESFISAILEPVTILKL